MTWDIEYTDLFGAWWEGLTEAEQVSVKASVDLLAQVGPELPFPYCSQVKGSKYGRMRELRIQHAGKPYRVLYAFDPYRTGILLLGGNKTGNDRWYAINIPRADALFGAHLARLDQEGGRHGKEVLGTRSKDATRSASSGSATDQRNARRNGARGTAPRAGFFAGRTSRLAGCEATEYRQARAANGHVYLHAA
jgi:hypothetical protein